MCRINQIIDRYYDIMCNNNYIVVQLFWENIIYDIIVRLFDYKRASYITGEENSNFYQ